MITPATPCHIGRLVFGVGLLLVSASNAMAQAGLVTTEENFRAEPNGVLLGQVRPSGPERTIRAIFTSPAGVYRR